MAVNLSAPDAGNLHPVPGIRLGVAEAGIRKANRKDLTVVLIEPGAAAAGVFTQNRFCAAPVQVCREHLGQGDIRAMVINTGNANAGTGQDGLARARATCVALARRLDLAPQPGAAVLDRRDHGAAAARAHRGRAAGGAGRRPARQLAAMPRRRS